MPKHEEVSASVFVTDNEFEPVERDPNDDAVRARVLNAQQRVTARQASLDPGDGLDFY